jgi:hypothetical protein
MNLILLLCLIKVLPLKNRFLMPLKSLTIDGFNQRCTRLLETGPRQTVAATTNRKSGNPVPSSDNMIINIFNLFITSFTIGALYSPLMTYSYYLWRHYTGSTNLVTLHWHEMYLLLTLMLLPLGAMKLLKINWAAQDVPG